MGPNDKFKLHEIKTTHRIDYQVPDLVPTKRYNQWTRVPEHPEKIIKNKPYAPKDVHTMQFWRDPNCMVPFDLLWTPKPIIRTYPKFTFNEIPKVEDPLKDEIIKTRPRLYMTPAVSMDDITDKELRTLLCKNMYTTEWNKASSEVKHTWTQRQTPNTTFEESGDPVRKSYSVFKPLPMGWKEKGKEWETRQYTTLVDPTKQFWVTYKHSLRTPVGRDPFEKLITDETRQEIKQLIAKDELRLGYDKVKPGYAGYVPRNMTGPMKRPELTLSG